MTLARVIVCAFFVLSMILLLLVFKTNILTPKQFKKYFVATTLVYISGTIMIFAIVFANKQMPWSFAIISELSILCVYVFLMYMTHRMGKNLQSIMEDIENKKIKGKNDEEID